MTRGRIAWLGPLGASCLLVAAACSRVLGLDDFGYIAGSGNDAGNGTDVGASDAGVPSDAAPPDTGTLDGPACDANTAIDPSNCGACGHGCLGGGCADAACQAVTLNAGPDAEAGVYVNDLVVDSTYAYWSTDSEVDRVPVDGGASELFYAPDPVQYGIDSLALDLAGLYVALEKIDGTGAVVTCPLGGCSSPSSMPWPQLVWFMALNGQGSLVFTSQPVTSNLGEVAMCSLPCTTTAATTTLAPMLNGAFQIVSSPSTAYVVASPGFSAIDAIPLGDAGGSDGGMPFVGGLAPLAIGGPMLVYLTPDGIYVTPLATASPVKIADLPSPAPRFLAADASYAYWGLSGPGRIVRCRLAGCNFQPETIWSSGPASPTNVAVQGGAIYWVDATAWSVMKLALPP